MNWHTVLIICGVLISYMVGAIPFGYVIVKLVRGIDIRTLGSGNIGATNVGRVLGRPMGMFAFVLDLAKGFLPPAVMAILLGEFDWGGAAPSLPVVLCGAAAICGHIAPPYLGFRGGKGVATGCGALLYLSPIGTVVGLVVWVIVVLMWRYVSLGSIIAALAFAMYALLFDQKRQGQPLAFLVFAILMAMVVILRHKSNIQRLLAGTENPVGGKTKHAGEEETTS